MGAFRRLDQRFQVFAKVSAVWDGLPIFLEPAGCENQIVGLPQNRIGWERQSILRRPSAELW